MRTLSAPDVQSSFEDLARQLEVTTREGDAVRVCAPEHSLGSEYNGREGALVTFNPGGWVVVRLHDLGERRFRADELKVL